MPSVLKENHFSPTHHRVEWIDIARGIAIIAMVIGHSAIPQTALKLIYSFHMPLFFVVSGLFYNWHTHSFWDLLKRKVLSLLLPYFVFSLIIIPFYADYVPPLQIIMYGYAGYALWFIPVLFMSEILFYPIAGLRKPAILVFACIFAVLGKILYIEDIFIPYKLNVVPFALLFISLGFVSKSIIYSPYPGIKRTFLYGIVTIAMATILPRLDMSNNDFGIFPLNLFNAVIGILFVFYISKYLDTFRQSPIIGKGVSVLDFFGKNSIYVMAFSPVLQNYEHRYLYSLSFFSDAPWYVAIFLKIIFNYLLTLLIIYIIAIFMNKYLPFLAGKKGRSKT